MSADGAENLLVSSGGATLVITDLELADVPGSAVLVEVPAGAVGTNVLRLANVEVVDTGRHGVYVDDLAGSSANVSLTVIGSTIDGGGTGELDQDGVRVDERGPGSITAQFSNTTVRNAGGDGIGLDEGDAGDVNATLTNVSLLDNGPFSTEDLDDGIDIDEAGDGGISLRASNITVAGSHDEGIDLDEEDNGDVTVTIINSDLVDNHDENLKVDEEDGGNVSVTISGTTIADSGDQEGVAIDETGAGNLTFRSTNVTNTGNDKEAFSIGQSGSGSGTARFGNTIADSPVNLDGVTMLGTVTIVSPAATN